MADKDDGHFDEFGSNAQDDSPDSVVDVEFALERRDREITQLKDSLLTEQRLANNLRSKIKKADATAGDLGTTRDLQSVLAEQRTLEEDSDQDVEERDLSLLQALSEERTAILRQ
ncbi:MAG: hypothetical protein ACR2QQ_00980, partial [Gammaproteobacteria bacterium]